MAHKYSNGASHEYGTLDNHTATNNQLQFIKPVDTPNTHVQNLPFQGGAFGSDQSPNMYQSYPFNQDQATSENGHTIADTPSPARHSGQSQTMQNTAAFTQMTLNRAISPENATNETLDRKFYTMMLEIDKRYQKDPKMQKHEKIRVEQWSRKLCQVTKNTSWKRNRNLYAMWLLDMILNKKLEKPFTKVPSDSNNLDMLQATEVKACLTQKVKALLSKRDRSDERKIQHSSQSQHQLSQVNEVSLRNNQAANSDIAEAFKQRSNNSRSRSGSMRRKRNRTATFAKVLDTDNDFQHHQQSLDNLNTAGPVNQGFAGNRSSIKTEKTNQSYLLNSGQQPSKHTRFQQQDDPSTLDAQFSVDLLPSSGQNGSFYNNPNQNQGSPQHNLLQSQTQFNRQAQQFNQETFDFYAPLKEDASVEAKAKIQDLQAQLVKMKSDKDVLEITVKHLKTELDSKSNLVRRQTDELATLRDSILELQRQNTLLRTQNLSSKQRSAHSKENQVNAVQYQPSTTACEVSLLNTHPNANTNSSMVMVSPVRALNALPPQSPPILTGQYVVQPEATLSQMQQSSVQSHSATRRRLTNLSPTPSLAHQRPQQPAYTITPQQTQPQQLIMVQQSPMQSGYKSKMQSDLDQALQQFGMDIERVFA